MKLSVIIPIKNGEKYLRECLDSVLNQTWLDMEVIAINDASIDCSERILDEYEKKYDRLKVIYAENLPVNAVRKMGVDISSGEYIGFVDCDDWVEKNMFEVLVSSCELNSLDMVVSGMTQELQGTSRTLFNMVNSGIYDKNSLEEYIYPIMLSCKPFFSHGIQPSLWNKVFKKELVEEVFESTDLSIIYGEDAAIVYGALLLAKRVGVIHESYYHYRIHSLSTVQMGGEELWDNTLRLHKQLLRLFEGHKQEKKLISQLHDFDIINTLNSLKKALGVDINERMSFCFPFENNIQDKKVAIYGAGKVGRDFFEYLGKKKITSVDVWVDKNFESINSTIIDNPEILRNRTVDYVIIAVKNLYDAKDIAENLKSMGYEDNQLLWTEYRKALY